jgi:hypothetical protein
MRNVNRILAALAAVSSCFAASVPTFSKDVYPIVRAKCQSCHQQGEIAPMVFTNFKDTRPWAKAIGEAVSRGAMPPWHADPHASARFENDRSLTAAERQTIAAWVASGAKEGKAIEYAAPRHRPETGWKLGKPDLVLRLPGFKVPAKGDVPYTFVVFPTNLKQDTWVYAAEWRIDKRTIVHHMNAFVRPPGSSYVEGYKPLEFFVPTISQRRVARTGEGAFERRELLIGFEPGYTPIPWGPKQGKLIKAGSDIVFECHFNPNGAETIDHSELAIYFAREAPAERVVSLSVQNMNFLIPPGDGNYQSDASVTFETPVKVVSVQPHMHLRGKAMRIEATLPGASAAEPVIDVPRYDFHWQTTYFLREPMLLPNGARLDCTAWFDNSPNNKYNPDAGRAVPWGDQSWDEMHIGFVEVAFDSRANADKLLKQ